MSVVCRETSGLCQLGYIRGILRPLGFVLLQMEGWGAAFRVREEGLSERGKWKVAGGGGGRKPWEAWRQD